jgi:hypothetical protein
MILARGKNNNSVYGGFLGELGEDRRRIFCLLWMEYIAVCLVLIDVGARELQIVV